MCAKIALGAFWILHFASLIVNNAGAADELRLVDESMDERDDAEIFRAVVQSMNQWQKNKEWKGHRRHKREASRVCYEDVGCFEDTGPFSYLEMLPSPPKDVGTRFLVYGSRKARSIPMEVPADRISDEASHALDPQLPTKVIVHGFGSSCDHVWVYEMRAALMAVIECNIVCVDWGPGSAVPNYVRAAANTRLVGRQLAKLVRSLEVPLDKLHLIGFSLGAHVAGFAGAELGNVSRITGLDPAGPLFEAQDPRARLDQTDAHYVDVIHSNGEQLILGGLGSWQPMGDVDFYPNGGRMQTGCSNLFVGAVSDFIWSNPVEGRSLCNHRRAYKLFTDSIAPKCRFPAFSCPGGYDALLRGECFPCGSRPGEPLCGDMGFYSDATPARGQLYLVTRDEEPFCAHQYQVKVYNSRHERPVKSYGKLQVTLMAEGSINETFTMTKKDDEELLVGATLQKIVVPHPAISSIDAIEVKYTAYSGWISSGLVSWSVDKVAVVDSYGSMYSVCKRGLVLESGRPVYLPLYDGDCSVPPEPDVPPATNSPLQPELDKLDRVEDAKQPPSIGPFTKQHNYEINAGKDSLTNEVPQKGSGPFTKEENIKIANEQAAKLAAAKAAAAKNNFAESSSNQKSYQGGGGGSSSWSAAELAEGGSNSVEAEAEPGEQRGRGFSGFSAGALLAMGSVGGSPPRRDKQPEMKEGGRSLRLPADAAAAEPAQPRPRGTRQDATGPRGLEGPREPERRAHELMDEAPSARGFTVQFLPERLAGILAQAERYARMTLLPLISQYTPSFIGGAKIDRPKYFPPLGGLFSGRDDEDSEERRRIVESKDSRTKYYYEFEEEKSSTTAKTSSDASVVYRLEQHLSAVSSTEESTANEWVPIPVQPLPAQQTADSRKEKSLEGDWTNESGASWTSRDNDTADSPVAETKIDDWVPMSVNPLPTSNSSEGKSAEPTEGDRKFIPLVEFAEGTGPSKAGGKEDEGGRAVLYPYVYERKNDPRTRYIPLIPEEDLGLTALNSEQTR